MSLATDDIITHTENPKERIKMLLELVSEFIKVWDTSPLDKNLHHHYLPPATLYLEGLTIPHSHLLFGS